MLYYGNIICLFALQEYLEIVMLLITLLNENIKYKMKLNFIKILIKTNSIKIQLK